MSLPEALLLGEESGGTCIRRVGASSELEYCHRVCPPSAHTRSVFPTSPRCREEGRSQTTWDGQPSLRPAGNLAFLKQLQEMSGGHQI